MAPQNIPQNQLDALPLLSVQDVTEGGTLTVIGGSINRLFTPTQLQVNGVAPTPVASYFVAPTPYLDLRGCSQFWLLVEVANPLGSGGNLTFTNAMHAFLQARFGITDTPPLFDPQNSILAGTFRDPGPGTGYAAGTIVTPGTSVRVLFGWSSAGAVSSDGQGQNIVGIGQNMRLVISAGSAAFTDARCRLTAWLEASS